eukprot:7389655-Prymnesium_polylepis.1
MASARRRWLRSRRRAAARSSCDWPRSIRRPSRSSDAPLSGGGGWRLAHLIGATVLRRRCAAYVVVQGVASEPGEGV